MDWIAAVICATNVLLLAYHNIWGWPVGIIACLLWIYVAIKKRVGGLVAVNLMIMGCQIIGWWNWVHQP